MPRRTVLRGAVGSLALLGLPSLGACRAAAPDPGGAPPSPPDVVRRRTVPISGVTDLATVVAGMRAFGLALHRATAGTGVNWTVSPLSIDVAFGMLRAGGRGATATQLDAVFGYPNGPAGDQGPGSPHAALNALTAHLVTTRPVGAGASPAPSGRPGPDPIVAVANGLFVDKASSGRISPAFLGLLASQYGAGPTPVRFADPSATAEINAWVARQTRNRITRLFDHLDPSTVIVLANAVYLKAAWLSQFGRPLTTIGAFTTAAGRAVSAAYMRQNFESARYAAGDGWQRVTLPYAGGELTMRIVVPSAMATDAASLGPALAAATGPHLTDRSTWIDLRLPRWDSSTSVPLIPALARLGLTDLGDLSGIGPGLAVSDAIHRADITVNEEGTVAAAATGIGIALSGRIGSPIVVRADRPFCWAVVHEPTGTPVFIGHVTDPTVGG